MMYCYLPVGGSVVCLGQRCSKNFIGVRFEDGSLVVLRGACVTMDKSNFSCDRESKTAQYEHVSMVIDGKHSSVECENNTKIIGGARGVIVQGGGCLNATDFEIMDIKLQGVVVNGVQSSATLKHCTLVNIY